MERLDTAYLSSKNGYASFAYGDEVIRFMTSPRLVRYEKVTKFSDQGFFRG